MSKVELVNDYYSKGLWSFEQVKKAVGKWIDEVDFEEITGEEYTEE